MSRFEGLNKKIFNPRKVEIKMGDSKWIPCNNTPALDIGVRREGNDIISLWTFTPYVQALSFLLYFSGLIILPLWVYLATKYLSLNSRIILYLLLSYIGLGLARLSFESLWWSIKLYRGELIENPDKVYSYTN